MRGDSVSWRGYAATDLRGGRLPDSELAGRRAAGALILLCAWPSIAFNQAWPPIQSVVFRKVRTAPGAPSSRALRVAGFEIIGS